MQPTSIPSLIHNYLTLHYLISKMVKVVFDFISIYSIMKIEYEYLIFIFFFNIRLATKSHDSVTTLFLNVSWHYLLNINFILLSTVKWWLWCYLHVETILDHALYSFVVSLFFIRLCYYVINFDKPTPTGMVSCCTIFLKQSILGGLHSILHNKSLLIQN